MTVTLTYAQYGAGQPLLILHGLFGSAKNWHSLAKRLGQSYQVYALDLRNHGQSPWAEHMEYTDLAADIRVFMQEHRLESAHLLGHSMGGKVAMYLALSSPALIKRLIVADIAPVTYTHSFIDYINAMQSVDLAQQTTRGAVDLALATAIPEVGIRQFLLQNLIMENNQFKWRVNLSVLAANMTTILEFPSITKATFDGETLFIAGKKSDYIQAEYEPIINNYFPNVQIKTIENAGHWVHAEKPTEFLDLVQRFLA